MIPCITDTRWAVSISAQGKQRFRKELIPDSGTPYNPHYDETLVVGYMDDPHYWDGDTPILAVGCAQDSINCRIRPVYEFAKYPERVTTRGALDGRPLYVIEGDGNPTGFARYRPATEEERVEIMVILYGLGIMDFTFAEEGE